MTTVTPSDLIQHSYCPRFIYFERCLRIPQHEELKHKVMAGRHVHDERLERNKGYLRERLGVVDKRTDVYLTDDLLRGRVDEVLTLQDGTMAPLDYKFARWEGRVYLTHQMQVQAYAVLIEKAFGVTVDRGYLVYTRSRNHVSRVEVNEESKSAVRKRAAEILEITRTGRFPKATRCKRQCEGCTYRNICPM